MYYIKRKNNRKRWFLKLVEMMLIFGIIFFGLDAVHQMVAPSRVTKVVVFQPQPAVVESRPAAPEPVLDAYDYHRLGLQHHLAGEYREAVSDYSRAIALNDDLAESWLNRGVAYEQLGNRYRAMYDFNRFLMRDGMTIITRSAISESMTTRISMTPNRRYDFPMILRDGQVVSISVVSVEPDWVDPLIVLVDGQGRPVVANDDVHRQDGSVISMNSYINNHTVTQSGRYVLYISHAGGGERGIRSGRIEVRITIED